MALLRTEEDFPRGSDDVLSNLERRKIRQEAERDALFQVS
jgi:hypothetical protein